jgi:hypothetical protein
MKPDIYQKQLREISLWLYSNGTHYKTLIQYFANLLTLAYIIEPNYTISNDKVDKEKILKEHVKVSDYVELMNIKHEFSKVLLNGFREDLFYGYVYDSPNSFTIRKINPNYCKVSSVEDGIFNFAFDFSYFNSYKDELPNYPAEFTSKYNTYLSQGYSFRWQELDSKNTVCIKVNEDLEFPLPPFAGIFEAVLEIEDYKALKSAKTEIGNYKMLVQKIPVRSDSDDNNDYLIDFDQAMLFHSRIEANLPEYIGLATTPMDVEDISFDKDRADTDNVAEAMKMFYSEAGVSDMLFNPSEQGQIGLSSSVKVDESNMFKVLRQIERWINRRFKQKGGVFKKWKIMMPKLTTINQDDKFEKYLKAAQYGVPTKSLIAASLDLSPAEMINLNILENDVFELNDKWIPLASSHTETGDAGRPEIDDDKKTDSGIKTKDKKANENKNK